MLLARPGEDSAVTTIEGNGHLSVEITDSLRCRILSYPNVQHGRGAGQFRSGKIVSAAGML